MSFARVYINKVWLLGMLMLSVMTASAQDNVEYRMEIGAGVNMTAYQGDFSESLVKNMQPGGAVVFRRILTPYMAIKVAAMYTTLKGDYSNAGTVYPDLVKDGYSFSHGLGDLTVAYEYNFLPYGTGKDYRGAKRISPFVSLGLGLTYANCKNGTWNFASDTPYSSTKGVVACNVPLGLGVKCKIGDRMNLILDWQMHFSLTDYLDGVKDPYHISSSGIFKNTDSYSTLSLSLTYCFSAKCPTCMKND